MKVGWKKSRISAVCLEMEIQDIIIEESLILFLFSTFFHQSYVQ